MDHSLNADAALRAYLPPESWNGDAQHRFVFRADDGDEESVLARLVVVGPAMRGKRFEHCVILRPENAEASRIFAVLPIDGLWMTRGAARRFSWSKFEKNFQGRQHGGDLSRFVLRSYQNRDVLLRFDADGQGEILERNDRDPDGLPTDGFFGERFDWLRDYSTPYSQRDLRFLRQSDADFQSHVQSEWVNPTSEIRITLNWLYLETEERDALAFRCQNGDWSSLRSMASLALRFWLGALNRSQDEVETCKWLFTDIDGIVVIGAALSGDEFLYHWRSALVGVFQPDNISAEGNIIVERPLCIWTHIEESEWRWIYVDSLTQHELIEAQLKLREWVIAHFSSHEAELLLAL